MEYMKYYNMFIDIESYRNIINTIQIEISLSILKEDNIVNKDNIFLNLIMKNELNSNENRSEKQRGQKILIMTDLFIYILAQNSILVHYN